MEDEIMEQIEFLLKRNIQRQLALPRLPKTYDGRTKPVRGGASYTPKPKNLTGALSNSVNVYFQGNEQNLSLVVDFRDQDYWYYVDQGRRPGKQVIRSRQAKKKDGSPGKTYYVKDFTGYPPLATIAQWVRQRPALANLPIEQRIYLTSRSIAQYGIGGINFIEAALKETEGELIQAFGDLAEEIINRLLNEKIFASENIVVVL
jgi:hypothetical protein